MLTGDRASPAPSLVTLRLPLPSRATLDYVYVRNAEYRRVGQAAPRTAPGRGRAAPASGLGAARARCAGARLGNHRPDRPVERPPGATALRDLFHLCRP